MMTSGAHASSFVVIEPPKNKISASIVVLGAPVSIVTLGTDDGQDGDRRGRVVTPAAATASLYVPQMRQISPSIVAFDSPMPDIAYEKVAAISPEKPAASRVRFSTPMVMRGGIIGDASSSAGARAAPVATAAPAGSKAAKTSVRKPGRNNAPSEPAPVVVAPPPPSMPRLQGVR